MSCKCKPIIINCCDCDCDSGDMASEYGSGWSPVLAVVSDGGRKVFSVVDWVGGTGEKPDTGRYIGYSGLVDEIYDGVDISGSDGLSAYEIAAVNGFDGTEQDWLESLRGAAGSDGKAATIQIGQTITGEPGEEAKVENVGTETDAVLEFTIPRGRDGEDGEGSTAEISPADLISSEESNALTLGIDGKLYVGAGDGGSGVRIPVTIISETSKGRLAGQPISIQATGSGVQMAVLDENGEFKAGLKPSTEYTVQVLPKSADDTILAGIRTFATGTLEIPFEVNIPAVSGNVYANSIILGDISRTVENNAPISTTITTSTFGNIAVVASGYRGGVLAPNGKIYVIPRNAANVIEIDPVAKTTTPFGDAGAAADKWWGGVLATNGKIYGIPYSASNILEIDPVTKTVSTFGNLGAGTLRWLGGVLAPNGKIYCMPYNGVEVLEIDPATKAVSTFGSVGAADQSWYGGVLAPNGKIYGIPQYATSILEIDPTTRTASTFGSFTYGGDWQGGCLGPNGKIYSIPARNSRVLEIDPITKERRLFGNVGESTFARWRGGVLAPNGKIYAIPSHVGPEQILEIDPMKGTVTRVGPSITGVSNGRAGAVLAPDGKIYVVPTAHESAVATVLEVSLTGDKIINFDQTTLLSGFINKL